MIKPPDPLPPPPPPIYADYRVKQAGNNVQSRAASDFGSTIITSPLGAAPAAGANKQLFGQ